MISSREIYIEKINTVQDYIECHLDEEIDIDKLSEIAFFSKYHFQRIFRQFTDESLYSYIKRLRLEKSVFLLSTSVMSMQDIALSVGFSNQASFAKALKEKYGMSGCQIRKISTSDRNHMLHQTSTNGKVSYDNLCYNEPMEVIIKNTEPTEVLYTRYTGKYKGDSALFSKLFTKLFQQGKKDNLLSKDTKWFVVYHDYSELTAEEKLRLSVCMSVSNSTSCHGEFGRMAIAGGKYAVGKFLLNSKEYQGAWNYMMLKWLPDSGYLPDDRLCYEYYAPDSRADAEGRTAVEIHIPLTPP